MIIVPYNRTHIDDMIAQEGQAYLSKYVTADHAKALEGKWAFTGKDGDKVLISAGVIELWPGRGVAWAYIDRDAGKCFPSIHKAVKRFIDYCPIRRIEATTDVGFEPANRWIKMLGFTLEAPVMKAYNPTGNDSSLWAKVKDV